MTSREKVRKVTKSSWRVITNPFIANANPKVPDGSTRVSVGQKFQTVRQIQAPLDNELTIVVYPGLGTCVTYGIGTKDHWCVPNYETHGGYAVNSIQGTYDGTNALPMLLSYNDDIICKWRLVSAGLKLSLVNNADENDGWFECARIQTSRNPNDWCFYKNDNDQNPYYNASVSPGPVVGDKILFGPKVTEVAPGSESIFGINPNQLIQSPTYKTGKLRDIHKYTFNLKPNGTDHSWTKFRENFPVCVNASTTTDTASGNGGGLVTSVIGDSGTTANHDDLIDRNVDQNYDAIVIRIHGRSTVSKTTLLAHVCSNQEIVYENGQNLARFHSPGEKASTATKKRGGSRIFTRKNLRWNGPMNVAWRRGLGRAFLGRYK